MHKFKVQQSFNIIVLFFLYYYFNESINVFARLMYIVYAQKSNKRALYVNLVWKMQIQFYLMSLRTLIAK